MKRLLEDRIAGIRRIRSLLVAEDYFYARLFGSSALGVAAILLIATVLLVYTIHSHSQDELRMQHLETTRTINRIEADLAGIETLHRDFLLTGKESYLIPFEKRKTALNSRLDGLKMHFLGDRLQRTRVLLIMNHLRIWLLQVALPEIQQQRAEAGKSPSYSPSPAAIDRKDMQLEEAHRLLDSIGQRETIASEFSIRQNQSDNPAHKALILTPKLEKNVSRMETAWVDHLITGDVACLESYQRALSEFREYANHLSLLLSETPSQAALLNEAVTGIERWNSQEVEPEFAARKANKPLAEILAIGQGKKNIGDARNALSELEVTQFSLSRKSRFYGTAGWITGTAILTLLCLLAVGVLIATAWHNFHSYALHLQRINIAEAENRSITTETRAIIETSLDAIIIIDNQGLVQSINPAGEKMFGCPGSEVLGKSVSKIIPQRLFLHDMASMGRGSIMALGQHHNQYTFPIEISLNRVSVQGKQQYVASIRDISDRKRSEETLKHIGISVSAHTGGEFLRSLVKQLCKALQSDFAFVVETTQKRDRVVNDLTISSKDNIRFENDFPLQGTACEEARKGFRAYPSDVCKEFPEDKILRELAAESLVAMNLRDHEGNSVGIMGVINRKPMENIQIAESTLQIFSARAASEIERKRFEEDLAAEKERLAVTLRSIGDGFIATDVEGNIVLTNSVSERLTGWSQERAFGRPLSDIFHILNERTRAPAYEIVQGIVSSGSLGDGNNRALIVSESGVERLIESSVAPIRDKSAKRIGVVLAFRDITEKERLETERRKTEKLESLGVAAGGIAHDFNNLLTSILGNLSLAMLETDDGGKISNYLTTAKRASLRAQDLSQQLLTFAKGGAPVKKTASIGQLIEDTVTFSLRGGKIRHVVDIPPNLWPVEIDPGQISQVIGNLTINAEQAMPAGGAIHVKGENLQLTTPSTALPQLVPGKYVKITIRDEGVGIPEEYIKKIFDPYFTTKPKGSGLGLATAYSIVVKHGGILTVESKPGAGSTFSIFLPATDKEILSEASYPKELVAGHGRVLVLDDEEEICSLVINALTPLGYEVVEAREGSQAIDLYKEALIEGRCFDVVISDLTIPGGMGGEETIRQLLEIDPEVKAIVSSGYANDAILSHYKDYGFLARITKPYEVTDLSHVVKNVIVSKEIPHLAAPAEKQG